MAYFPDTHIQYEAHTVDFWTGIVCRNVLDFNYVLVFVNDKNDSMFVPKTKSRRLPTCKSHQWRQESQLESVNRLTRALFDAETRVLENIHSKTFNTTLHMNPFLVETTCEKNGTAEVIRWSLGSYNPAKPMDKLLDKPEREGSWIIQEIHWFDALHHVGKCERGILEAAIRAFQRHDQALTSQSCLIKAIPNKSTMERGPAARCNPRTRGGPFDIDIVKKDSGSENDSAIHPDIPGQDARRSSNTSRPWNKDREALPLRNKTATSVPQSVRDRVKVKRRGKAQKTTRQAGGL